jgi:uncharacterized membrane protein
VCRLGSSVLCISTFLKMKITYNSNMGNMTVIVYCVPILITFLFLQYVLFRCASKYSYICVILFLLCHIFDRRG